MRLRLKEPIEIFYPGLHTCSDGRRMTFSRSEVESWAAAKRVPLIPGHESKNALGFATAIEFNRSTNRLVVTEVEDVDPAFKAVVNSGQLNRVSVKVNPVRGGKWTLDHVAFLGRSEPALAHLKPAKFSKSTGVYINMFVDDEDDAQALEFARQELDLAAREEEFERQQAMFSAQQKWSPQVDRLVNEGKVYPSERANVLALLAQSEVANTTMEFEAADGKKQVSSAQFQFEILDRSKPKITYGEKTSVAADQDYDGSASFEVHAYAPSEFSIAPDAMTMHEDILATGVKPSDHNGYLAEYKKRSKQQRRKAG